MTSGVVPIRIPFMVTVAPVGNDVRERAPGAGVSVTKGKGGVVGTVVTGGVAVGVGVGRGG